MSHKAREESLSGSLLLGIGCLKMESPRPESSKAEVQRQCFTIADVLKHITQGVHRYSCFSFRTSELLSQDCQPQNSHICAQWVAEQTSYLHNQLRAL